MLIRKKCQTRKKIIKVKVNMLEGEMEEEKEVVMERGRIEERKVKFKKMKSQKKRI